MNNLRHLSKIILSIIAHLGLRFTKTDFICISQIIIIFILVPTESEAGVRRLSASLDKIFITFLLI